MRQFYQHYFIYRDSEVVLVALVKRPTTINHA